MSFQHILDNIRDNIGGELKHIHLLTRKDIRNIEKSYHLNSVQQSNDDTTSVACWVQEMKEIPENIPAVFFYKQQERLCYRHTNNHTKFHDEEIWSPKNLCIDSTQENNGYDFLLVTIVVVDEFGDGYLVGWFLSNRERTSLYWKTFLNQFRKE